MRLRAKRAAAPARRLDVRVVELEARPFQGLDEVHLSAVQIQQTRLVDEHLEVLELIGLVQQPGTVLESHRVAESGAASADHGNAESGGFRFLRVQDFLHLGHGGFCQLNHCVYPSIELYYETQRPPTLESAIPFWYREGNGPFPQGAGRAPIAPND